MIIRKAEEKDIPRIIELLGQVLQIHADIRPDIFIPGTTKYTVDELTELAGGQSASEKCADVRSSFYGRDGEDSFPGENGLPFQQRRRMSNGGAAGCGDAFCAEGVQPGLYSCGLY